MTIAPQHRRRVVSGQCLRARIIHTLRESGWATTPELVAVCGYGMPHARSQVWNILRSLLWRDLVVRTIRQPGQPAVWRLVTKT